MVMVFHICLQKKVALTLWKKGSFSKTWTLLAILPLKCSGNLSLGSTLLVSLVYVVNFGLLHILCKSLRPETAPTPFWGAPAARSLSLDLPNCCKGAPASIRVIEFISSSTTWEYPGYAHFRWKIWTKDNSWIEKHMNPWTSHRIRQFMHNPWAFPRSGLEIPPIFTLDTSNLGSSVLRQPYITPSLGPTRLPTPSQELWQTLLDLFLSALDC